MHEYGACTTDLRVMSAHDAVISAPDKGPVRGKRVLGTTAFRVKKDQFVVRTERIVTILNIAYYITYM